MQILDLSKQFLQGAQNILAPAAALAAKPVSVAPPPVAASTAPAKVREVSIEKAIQQIEGFLAETNRKLSVSFDDASNRYITRVINKSTGEVIRTIPEEETLEIARSVKGHLVNLRA
jgi:hypothetical protein